MKLTSAALFCAVFGLVAAAPAPVAEPSAAPTASGNSTVTDGTQGKGHGHHSKRGIAYNNPGTIHEFPAEAVTWGYNYASTPGADPSPFKHGREYVPMLYNGNDPDWEKNVEHALKHGSKHLLAMNEPDQPTSVGGTALSPQDAAHIYKSKMNKFKGRAKLGAPAVSAGGLSWLKEFVQACNGGCHVDFVPLHFYDTITSAKIQAESMEGFLKGAIPQVRKMFHNKHMPIWITEFAALPVPDINISVTVDYMDKIMPWLNSHDFIDRYSYFKAEELVSGGKLNKAGKRYSRH